MVESYREDYKHRKREERRWQRQLRKEEREKEWLRRSGGGNRSDPSAELAGMIFLSLLALGVAAYISVLGIRKCWEYIEEWREQSDKAELLKSMEKRYVTKKFDGHVTESDGIGKKIRLAGQNGEIEVGCKDISYDKPGYLIVRMNGEYKLISKISNLDIDKLRKRDHLEIMHAKRVEVKSESYYGNGSCEDKRRISFFETRIEMELGLQKILDENDNYLVARCIPYLPGEHESGYRNVLIYKPGRDPLDAGSSMCYRLHVSGPGLYYTARIDGRQVDIPSSSVIADIPGVYLVAKIDGKKRAIPYYGNSVLAEESEGSATIVIRGRKVTIDKNNYRKNLADPVLKPIYSGMTQEMDRKYREAAKKHPLTQPGKKTFLRRSQVR